jgi:putative nucleotidyltransferase with HDIG domain
MMERKGNIAVLFVDDDDAILESYRRVLLKRDRLDLQAIRARRQAKGVTHILSSPPRFEFNVLIASSGEEGLKLVQQEKKRGHRVAVGFFDINMPNGMNGLETIKRVKELEPDMLCAIVTAYTDHSIDNISQVFRHQDEWIYFNKPFTKGELEQAVINLVSLWNHRRLQQRLLSRLQENNDELIRIANEINLKPNLDQTLDFIIDTIREITNSHRISIMLLDDDKQYLSIKKAIGIDKKLIKSIHIKPEESIAADAWKQGKILLVNDVHKLGWGKSYSSFKSFISVPLVIMGLKTYNNPLGIINVTNKADNKTYTESELKILSYIANSASIAINNHLNIIKLEEAYFNTVEALATAIEAKDPYTRGHSKMVAEYASRMAKELGLPKSEIKLIRYGAILHDIGKIALDSSIIQKPQALSESEYAEVQKHPLVGESMIKKIRFLEQVMKIVRHHHERYNGKGYPDRIRADKIELGARIIAVADAYDAMLSVRPYRNALSREEAIAELERHSGKQFDPQCVAVLLKCLNNRNKKTKHQKED